MTFEDLNLAKANDYNSKLAKEYLNINGFLPDNIIYDGFSTFYYVPEEGQFDYSDDDYNYYYDYCSECLQVYDKNQNLVVEKFIPKYDFISSTDYIIEDINERIKKL